jgi:anti-sigma factor RsiW
MNCMQVARVLQSYLDGETDEVTARRVAAHVADCRRCGLEAEVYQQIKQSLSHQEPPPADAVTRLRDFGHSLRHEDDGGRSGGPSESP